MIASGGWFQPPVARFFFSQKYRQIVSVWLFAYGSKILLPNFFKKVKGSSFPRKLSRELFSRWGKRKFAILEVFRAYLRKFSIFFHEIFMVARSNRVLAADIKSLLISTLGSLETRLKVTIFAIFWRFWAFFELSV